MIQKKLQLFSCVLCVFTLYFTKRLPGLRSYSYQDRLQLHSLKLQSLEQRRLRAALVWGYKIMFGLLLMCNLANFLSSMYVLLEFINTNCIKKRNVSCVWSTFLVNKTFTNKGGPHTRHNQFVNVWNSLPDNSDFSTLPRFRRSILRVSFTEFLKCFIVDVLCVFMCFYFCALSLLKSLYFI